MGEVPGLRLSSPAKALKQEQGSRWLAGNKDKSYNLLGCATSESTKKAEFSNAPSKNEAVDL